MIETLPLDLLYPVAAIAGTAALSLLAGREWGRRALKALHASRTVVDTVCDAIADGELTRDEAEEIAIVVNSWLMVIKEPAR